MAASNSKEYQRNYYRQYRERRFGYKDIKKYPENMNKKLIKEIAEAEGWEGTDFGGNANMFYFIKEGHPVTLSYYLWNNSVRVAMLDTNRKLAREVIETNVSIDRWREIVKTP